MEGPTEESGLVKATDNIPFMLHVLVVLIITWLFSSLGSNSVIFLCLCAVYLFQVEKRGRERDRRRIAFEERKKANTERPLTEGETLRWLNEGVKRMWPVCMEKFASKHFFGPMAPWFLNYYKPWSVSKVTLQSLKLGATPPVFSFIRALEQPRGGDHVVFEAAMEFVSGDDMNAEMSVQTVRRLGGFWTTFYISNLHIEGNVKFSVRFLEGWPVIGRVRFCFANAPYVTMTAKPISKKGVDVSLIPGLANWVEKTLATALEQSVVEPNLLVVDMEKLVSNMMWPDPRPQHAKANGNGITDFFHVDNKSALPQMVLVEILDATELKAADRNGYSDPFVELTLGQNHRKTRVKSKTLNPKWDNELHRLPIVNWDLANLLTLRVRDKDFIGRSDELGICSVEVKDYRDGERHELTLPLEAVPTGKLRFAITVESNKGVLLSCNEPRTSGPALQTMTQESDNNGSDANHTSPGTAAVMTRSKSDTNLGTPPDIKGQKHARHSSTGEIGVIPTLLEHTPDEGTIENSETIDMPYGPPGTFTIHHPGPAAPMVFPPSRNGSIRKPVSQKNDKVDVDPKDRELKRSMLRFLRLKRRGAGVSQDTGLAERETNMSEQSGYTSSLDRSTELKVLKSEPYHGTVKMNLVCPDTNDIAPVEPPEMYVFAAPTKLEPILSGVTPKTPEPNHDHFVDEFVASRGQGEVLANGSIMPSGLEVAIPGFPQTEETKRDSKVVVNSSIGSSGRYELGSPLQRPPKFEKQNSKNMADWWKKVKVLMKVAKKRKKQRDSNGIDFSTELNIPTEVCVDDESQDYHDDSDTSAAHSFRKESLDVKTTNYGVTLVNVPGESPELRRLINNSRPLVSQSCRQEPIDVKRIISSTRAPVSQSLRHESIDLHKIMPSAHSSRDSSLRTIPEKHRTRQTPF